MPKIKNSTDYKVIESLLELEEFFLKIPKGTEVVFDWETTGLEHTAIPLGMSICYNNRPVFIPIDYFFSKGLPMTSVARICNEYFPNYLLIGHNVKYDSMINFMNGLKDECTPIYRDTLVMMHLYDPSLDKQLEKAVKNVFGYEKKPFKDIVGKKWNQINWAVDGDSLLDLLAGYACEDTFWTLKIYQHYLPLLDEDAIRVLDRIEMPFMWVLRDMKLRGVQIDVSLLKDMGSEVDGKLQEVVEAIYEEAGCVFNLNSPKQKQDVFYNKMKMPVLKYTKTGAPSTDSDTMEELSDMGFNIGHLMTEYSELQKLNSGYIQAIPQLVDEDSVLRGDINSCGTETGRCSSSNPNLQNQPNNNNFPVRKAFVPRKGYVFLNHDYSQLELRVMAHMSKDARFLEVFRKGEDPHSDVAKSLGISRKGAKIVNFGVLYGMGPQKLAATIAVSEDEARRIITRDYMTTYSGFARWKEATENFAQKNGYVKNLFGRMRRLPEAMKDPYHRDKKKFYGALRQSVNTIIQGTGADLMKLAMIQVHKRFKQENLDAHLLIQVHDEVLVEASVKDMFRAEEIIIDCLENTTKLIVPLPVDGKIINNWAEMKNDALPSVPFRFDYMFYSLLNN